MCICVYVYMCMMMVVSLPMMSSEPHQFTAAASIGLVTVLRTTILKHLNTSMTAKEVVDLIIAGTLKDAEPDVDLLWLLGVWSEACGKADDAVSMFEQVHKLLVHQASVAKAIRKPKITRLVKLHECVNDFSDLMSWLGAEPLAR
jgi:hypothetical protein